MVDSKLLHVAPLRGAKHATLKHSFATFMQLDCNSHPESPLFTGMSCNFLCNPSATVELHSQKLSATQALLTL